MQMFIDSEFPKLLENESSFKNKIKEVIDTAAYISGATWAFSKILPNTFPVALLYHSVLEEDEISWVDPRWSISRKQFSEQMEFLSKYRNVISFADAIVTLNQNKSFPVGTVILEFDDGYLSTLQIAAPILKKYQFPATLLLPTAMMDSGVNMWIDELYSAFLHRTNSLLHFPWVNEAHLIKTSSDAAPCYESIRKHLTFICSVQMRTQLLNDIIYQLAPSNKPPRLLLNWNDVRALIKEYPLFEIGSHTHNHLAATAIDKDTITYEIEHSKHRLQEEIDRPPKTFSFPYSEVSKDGIDILKKNHFEATSGNTKFNPLFTPKKTPFIFTTTESNKCNMYFEASSFFSLQPSLVLRWLKTMIT